MPIGIDVIRALLGSSSQDERPKAFFVERLGGLGDVIMALGAIQGLRAEYPEARIYLHTEPRYADLAERCPFLDGVFTSASLLRGSMHEHLGKKFDVKRFELGIYSFGINHDHQINAFLLAMDIHAPSKYKEARVELRPEEAQKAHEKIQSLLGDRPGKRIVFHPARGDKNRTWPARHWDRLATLVLEAGHQPIVVGDDSTVPFKGVMKIPAREGLLNLTNQLSILELVQLFRECDVFVSPDSGPVQVAGLTDIGIVGIYSTVPPHCRLPFRHGMEAWRARGMVSDCPHQGCYQLFLKEDSHFETLQAAIREDLLHPGCQATNTLMGDYCVRKDRIYACLEDITPQKVWRACEELLETDYLHLANQFREAQEAIGEGEPGRALGLLEALERQHPTAEVKVGKATALCLEGRWQEAVDLLEGVISEVPCAEALNLLGLICHLQGDEKKAPQFFESSLKWNEAYLPALMNTAIVNASQALATGAYLEGLLSLDFYISLLPNLGPLQKHHVFASDQAYTIKGWLMLQLSQSQEAREAFESAIELNPRGAEAIGGLAEFCYRTGDEPSATRWYQRLIQVQPKSLLAAERLAAMSADSGEGKTCPVCKGATSFAVLKHQHPYYRCGSCGAVFTPRIDPAVLRTENEGSEARNTDELDRIRFERISSELGRVPNDLIDFGCGEGQFAKFLQSYGIQVSGIDQNTALQLDQLCDGACEAVSMIEVIEHLADPHMVFEQIARILKPGGVLYVESSFVSHQELSTWAYLDPAIGHCFIHSHDSIGRLAEAHGFVMKQLNDNVYCLRKRPDKIFEPSQQPVNADVSPAEHTDAQNKEAFLYELRRNDAHSIEVLASYLSAFTPGEPVALILVSSSSEPEAVSLEMLQEALFTILSHSGQERFPDILFVDRHEDIISSLRNFDRIQWIPKNAAEWNHLIGANGVRLAQARHRLVEALPI